MDVSERFIGSNDLFFSTTDRRGVITSANGVFTRISGYSLDELLGRPHNLVRNPLMPGAAFAVMWSRLTAGRPMAAYVANRAKTGETYWVFATVTPIPDGYLSVRVAPRSALFSRVREVYDAVARFEAGLRESGTSRSEAAAAGVGEMTRLLGALGYDRYDDLIDEALPLEVAARAGRVAERASQGGALPGEAGRLLDATRTLDADLAGVLGRLDQYGRLAAALTATASEALAGAEQISGTVAAARAAGELATSAPVLGSVATAMSGLADQARESLEALVADLRGTAALVAGLRFRAALSGLHNDMAATFAFEMADGAAGPDAHAHVGRLAEALGGSLEDLAVTVPEVNARMAGLGSFVDEAVARFTRLRSFAGKWCSLVYQRGLGPELGRYVDLIDADLARGHALLLELREVGAASGVRIADLDLAGVGRRLHVLQGTAVA